MNRCEDVTGGGIRESGTGWWRRVVDIDPCEYGTQLRLRSLDVVFVRDGQTFDESVEAPVEGWSDRTVNQ